MNGPLKALNIMLNNADRVRPWKARELAEMMNIPISSAYRHLNQLKNNNIIQRFNAGYMLAPLVLESGSKRQMGLAKITARGNTEELYE